MSTLSTTKLLATITAAALFSAWLTSHMQKSPIAAEHLDPQPAFARIMNTHTLRCGYVNYAPGTLRDPKTGMISGIAHDVVETAAAKLNIKVVWAEETSWGNHLEGLSTGRYDMLCASSFTLPSDAARAEAVGPLYYSGIGVYVRADDTRFDESLASIDRPQTVISAIDGTIPAIIAAEQFSKARLSSHPQLTDYTFNTTDVATGKADVTFVENYYGMDYLAHNPGKLKDAAKQKPLRVYPNNLLVNKGEFKLQSMFQNVIAQMLNNGELDDIIDNYERYPGALIRVVKPYRQN